MEKENKTQQDVLKEVIRDYIHPMMKKEVLKKREVFS